MPNQISNSTRRQFIQSSAGLAALGSLTPYWFTGTQAMADHHHAAANDRPTIGCIGVGSRWFGGLRDDMYPFANIVALADVDAHYADRGRAQVAKDKGHAPDIYEDYRHLLDRDDIETVSIATPDHWHSKIAIEALRSGKDVYCEKPVTLTIDEGKRLCKVVKETGRVFQVGTQQRTDMGRRFLQALALVQEGRLGEITRARVAIGGAPTSKVLPVADVPKQLNWERWLGQAPLVDYRFLPADHNERRGETRGHYEFRWWYEYSGGKMTDWGAHHVDIAQWAIGMDKSGPTSVELVSVEHPVPFKNGMPTLDDRYNTATSFRLECKFPNGVEMAIASSINDPDGVSFGNGIMLEGTKGRIFVSRGDIKGKPVEDLKDNPLPEDALDKVYGGKVAPSHMANFFDCVKTRKQPISDIFTHHRALSTCHLSNIALRLGRSLKWDPAAEQMVGDDEANAWQTRKQRKGYEIPS